VHTLASSDFGLLVCSWILTLIGFQLISLIVNALLVDAALVVQLLVSLRFVYSIVGLRRIERTLQRLYLRHRLSQRDKD
jgi:hypothetical protein